MENETEKCEAGCIMFTGGEIKHDKNCVYYPESRTKMYDDLQSSYTTLKAERDRLEKLLEENKKSFRESLYRYRKAIKIRNNQLDKLEVAFEKLLITVCEYCKSRDGEDFNQELYLLQERTKAGL